MPTNHLLMGLLQTFGRACVLALCFPALLWAHLMPAQQGTLNVMDSSVFVAVALPASALSKVDTNHDGRLSPAELSAHMSEVQAQLTRRFRLFDGEQAGHVDFVQPMAEADERTGSSPDTGAPYFLALMKFSFSAAPQSLRMQTDLFGDRPEEQQLTFKATRGEEAEAVVLTPRHMEHSFFRGPWRVLQDYLLLGVEHILLGADHLLFLLTIIVAGVGWRYWLGVLTSFTVAHSLTLTAALFGWVHAAPALVEPLIAGSIVLMALLNLWGSQSDMGHRMAIVFACGLLHGLGFASAMGDMGLHGVHRAASIAGFNLGIELGQAGFLIVLLAVARMVSTIARPLPMTRMASLGAALVGAFWLLERLQ